MKSLEMFAGGQVPDKRTGLSLGGAIVYTAYMVEATELPWSTRLLILSLMLCQFVFRPMRMFWLIWLVVFILMAAQIVHLRFLLANHHYVLTYLALAFFVSTVGNTDQTNAYINANARYMLAVIMCFATLHRVLSPTFMDGSYIGFMISKGGFFGWLADWFPSVREIIEYNQEQITHLSEKSSTPEETVLLKKPFANYEWVVKITVWMMLIIEVLIGVVALFFHRKKVTHYLLLAFVLILSLMRQELEFISILTLLGYAATDETQTRLSVWYLLLIPVFAAQAILIATP